MGPLLSTGFRPNGRSLPDGTEDQGGPMVRSFGAHIRTNLTAYLALLVALAGTGTYGAAPPFAAATVSTSTLTQPVDGTRLSYDDRLPPSTVTVAGSTNGVSGDTVTLLCDDGGMSKTLLGPDIAVAFDGSFSAAVPLSDFSA